MPPDGFGTSGLITKASVVAGVSNALGGGDCAGLGVLIFTKLFEKAPFVGGDVASGIPGGGSRAGSCLTSAIAS